MTSTATLTDQAAETLASLLPSRVPLTARPAAPVDRPEAGTDALVASYVGHTSVELVLAISTEITEALAAMENLTPEEALRPALEAAAQRIGPGVLGPVETRPASEVLGGGGATVFVLEADDTPQAWFGIRERGTPSTTPAGPLPAGSMNVLYDVEMTLTAEIGRTRLPVREVLSLTPGAILELDRSAGSPADVMVNGRLVARGEVVVVDEDYAIRVTEIITPVENSSQ